MSLSAPSKVLILVTSALISSQLTAAEPAKTETTTKSVAHTQISNLPITPVLKTEKPEEKSTQKVVAVKPKAAVTLKNIQLSPAQLPIQNQPSIQKQPRPANANLLLAEQIKSNPRLRPLTPAKFEPRRPNYDCAKGDNDRDGDGSMAIECGGNDCDDYNPRRYPGAIEVCDDRGLDEDCDISTAGLRDADADGHIDMMCFNTTDSGQLKFADTYPDCDDANPKVNPLRDDICNNRDDDCDGFIDEDICPDVCPTSQMRGSCVANQ
ncbi:putative metal-binding motif-containing protein [Microbulbifer pacificus]|uniref:putative metal-binding motif-containing protein n=1 Tax=Microbulbifer pacificus TaxID=407164 RepID=UPI000CF4C1E2|nr:putative metal-binding motif-containing protein [Microbulbifer pacificus]